MPKSTKTSARRKSAAKIAATAGRARRTIKGFVCTLLMKTATPYAAIAQKARGKFEGAQTSPASVRHYASKLRRDGVKVKERPVAREAAFG